MVLHRYMKSHWLETLRDGHFKMAKINDFNDPFDGKGCCIGLLSKQVVKEFAKEENTLGELVQSINGRIILDAMLDTMVEAYSSRIYRSVQNRSMVDLAMYVLCFSACTDNDPAQRLMWAHYANGYRGVRIGVRFDDPHFPLYLDSIKYCYERPVLDLAKVTSINNDPEIQRFWISNLTTKSTEWAYEQEFRLIADDLHLERGKDDNGNEAFFWRFAPRDIVSVDVGCQVSKVDLEKLIEFRNSTMPHMAISQVTLNEVDYGISYQNLIDDEV